MKVDPAKHWKVGWDLYERRLLSLIDDRPQAEILELGGGGRPMWGLSEIPANVAGYTVNDFDPRELDKIDAGYKKACFDVCGDVSAFAGRYDIVFSRFLAEHVPDGRKMHENIWQLLKPGGVAIHLIPTLFASPFLINRFFPENLTHKLLVKFFPYRAKGKFPAYYSMCRGNTPSMRSAMERIGYDKVEISDFYGHLYYDKIPLVRQIEENLSALAARLGWTWYSSYAVIEVRK